MSLHSFPSTPGSSGRAKRVGECSPGASSPLSLTRGSLSIIWLTDARVFVKPGAVHRNISADPSPVFEGNVERSSLRFSAGYDGISRSTGSNNIDN